SVLLLPMTVALGAAFTLALAVAESGVESVGRDTAGVYVSNTLGAIAGSLVAGYFLVPRFGLQATFTLTSRAGIARAVAIAAWSPLRTGTLRRRSYMLGGLIAAGAVVAIGLGIPEWDRRLLSSGAYKYAPYIHAGDADAFEASLRAGRLEYYKEGAAATVS